VRPETEPRIFAKELPEEELQRPFKVGNADPFIDVEAFHLRELRKVRGIDLVPPVRRPWSDDPDRRRSVFHGADLHRAGVRAQEAAVGEIEGILLVARRVIGRRIQRVEAVKLVLDVRSFCECETHAAEDLDRASCSWRDRVQRARRWAAPGASHRHWRKAAASADEASAAFRSSSAEGDGVRVSLRSLPMRGLSSWTHLSSPC
jgi:hypothetical protein